MSTVIAALTSIWAIAALAWAVRRALRLPICPICAGVAGTWAWMLIARYMGVSFDPSMLPILLGGSVVGLIFWSEPHLPAQRSPALWKSLAIPLGFAAAYALHDEHWGLLAAALVAMAAATIVFFFKSESVRATDPESIERLKKQMEHCC